MHPQAELAAVFGVDLYDPLPSLLHAITEAMRALCDALASEKIGCGDE